MAAVEMISFRSASGRVRHALTRSEILDVGDGDAVGAVSFEWIEFIGIGKLSLCGPVLDAAGGDVQQMGGFFDGANPFIGHAHIIRKVRNRSRSPEGNGKPVSTARTRP